MSGLRIIVTNQRVMLLNRHKLSIPLEKIRAYRVERDALGLIVLVVGVFFVILAFIAPSTVYASGGGFVGVETFPIFIVIGALCLWWGYKHLERLEIVLRDGSIHIIRGRGLKDIEVSIYKAKTGV